MKLGVISKEDAEYLGMSVKVAGGWIMIPGEWANSSRTIDMIQESGDRSTSYYLAHIPEHMIESLDFWCEIDPEKLATMISDDIKSNEKRKYCLKTRGEDLEGLEQFRARIASILAAK